MASTCRRMVASVLLVALLLLVASEMGTTEARHCMSQSHHFKGACVSSSNCKHVCHTEGFPFGECVTRHLVRSMCYCKKPC